MCHTFAARGCIMVETEVEDPNALGGLLHKSLVSKTETDAGQVTDMIPNIPFSQWVGVPQ